MSTNNFRKPAPRRADEMWLTPALGLIAVYLVWLSLPTQGYFEDIESVSDIIDGVYWTFVEPYEDIVSFVRYVHAEQEVILDYAAGIAFHIFLCVLFYYNRHAVWQWLGMDDDEPGPQMEQNVEEEQTKKPTAIPITPPASSPPRTSPTLSTRTPSPPFPFKNFRATGESFVRNQYNPYYHRVPESPSYKTATTTVLPEPEEAQSTIDVQPEPANKAVAIISPQQTPTSAPVSSAGLQLALTQPPASSPLRAMEDIQTHPETLGTAPAQRSQDQQTPPPVISVDDKITVVFTNLQ